MNFETSNKFNLKNFLPGELKNSMLCYTLVNSKAVDNAPDIAICCSNGYMYEIKNKRVLRSLNLQDDTSSLSCYYLTENKKKIIIIYLVLSARKDLLIVRRTNAHLKIVKEYQDVKNFQVYDFEGVGVPQIRIDFLNYPGKFMCDFPIEFQTQSEYCDYKSRMQISLSKELEDLKKYIDILNDEYNQLKKICFCSKMPTVIEEVFVGSPSFYMSLGKFKEYQLETCSKWFKVFGSSFIFGINLQNVGSVSIDDLEVIINHKKIKDYNFIFFQSTCDTTELLFSNQQYEVVKRGEKICAVVSFEIPKFYCESVLSVPCYVTSKDLKNLFIKEIFEISVIDIARQTTVNLEDEFTVEDLLAIVASTCKTRLKIQSEDCTNDIIEGSLEYLGFKLIKHLKDKLFYCTSTYLKEVFVAFLQISANPSVWKMTVFTSKEEHIYFLVQALYDLLPDNSSILCDDSTD